MNQGALSKLTVIDLTRVLAGPYCSMFLADMGAKVIKVELPGKGDDTRGYVPQIMGESAYFMNINRGKRGITLNLKSEKGRKILLALIEKADVVLENFRPGVMERLGLDYETLSLVNPRLVYGCVSGFGHYGPCKSMPGYDIIAQAVGGLMSTTGWPGGDPTRSGTAIGDILAGLSVAIGVLAAYIKAQETGIGQKVDVALVDSVVSSLEIINQIYLTTGQVPQRIGNRYEASYPYDSFHTKDGLMVIGAANDKLFRNMLEVMGMPELMNDERFSNNPSRVKNHAALKPIMEDWLKDYETAEVVAKLLEKGVPAAPINTIDQVVNDEHIAKAREMFVNMEHPKAGRTVLTGNQIKMSKTPVRIVNPSPLLGEHTFEVMHEMLGMTQEEFKTLGASGTF